MTLEEFEEPKKIKNSQRIDHMFVVDTRYASNLCAFKHCQKPQNEHVEEAFLESDRDYSIDPHRGM